MPGTEFCATCEAFAALLGPPNLAQETPLKRATLSGKDSTQEGDSLPRKQATPIVVSSIA